MQWLPLLVLSALSVGASVITRPDPQTTEDNGSAYLLADLFSRATKSWECTNATHDYIVTKDQINSALGHDVPLWKTRSDKRWQGGQSYPHRMRTGAIEGFDLQRTPSPNFCGGGDVGTAPIMPFGVMPGKEYQTNPGVLRVLISWTSDNGKWQFCGVAFHHIHNSNDYKMCTERSTILASDHREQIIYSGGLDD